MAATLLTGKPVADALLTLLKNDVKKLDPKLVVVQVGNDPASTSYITQKIKSCDAVGMRHEHIHLPQSTSLDELLAAIDRLNLDPDVTGFIVQLPLPEKLAPHTTRVIESIHPTKDIDGFTATNIGRMFLGLPGSPAPATPSGVMQLLDHYNIDVEGRHAVVIGRSNIVGKPLATILTNRGATVSVCHSRTQGLSNITRQADLLFLAVGKPRMITGDMVKPGAIVIDIGVSRVDGKLVGDADMETVQHVASAITPVPGGIGPLTVASLISNCVQVARGRGRGV